VKIDPASLPKAPNLHYPGSRDYKDLPREVAHWDVCLMPFAMNEATRFISPTKVLEYMAAERPIVSTPITDVAEPYGDVVRIARTAEEFIAACDAALADPPEERDRRIRRMREIVATTSWHNTVAGMAALIDDVTHRKGEPQWQHTTRSSSAPVPPA
jgi:UDP-galactopyranose mutase